MKIFTPTERKEIEKRWNITLPDVTSFLEIRENDGIPEKVPEDFLNMDFVFTDTHYGRTCLTENESEENN